MKTSLVISISSHEISSMFEFYAIDVSWNNKRKYYMEIDHRPRIDLNENLLHIYSADMRVL